MYPRVVFAKNNNNNNNNNNKQTNKGTSYVINRADLIEGRFSAANPGLVTTTSQLLWFQLTKTENDSFSLSKLKKRIIYELLVINLVVNSYISSHV